MRTESAFVYVFFFLFLYLVGICLISSVFIVFFKCAIVCSYVIMCLCRINDPF